jgi:hypothetical protein
VYSAPILAPPSLPALRTPDERFASLPGGSTGRLLARGGPHASEAGCAACDAPFPSSEFRAATPAVMAPLARCIEGRSEPLRVPEGGTSCRSSAPSSLGRRRALA